MEIKEAVALIKSEVNMRVVDRNVREAIDTVVSHCEKHTYTADETQDFAEWTAIMQWIYDHTDKCWFQKHSTETKTTTKLRELWEVETGRKEATE